VIRCWVTKGDGSVLSLPTVVSWQFNYGTDTPCDSFAIKCVWQQGQEKDLSCACRFSAQWDGQRVFTGVLDEFAITCGRDGLYLELYGRGMAAVLLDNEAMPMEYQRATRWDIIENHVTPYGIPVVGGWQMPAVDGFTVSAGESEWSVMRRYACYYGGVVPRFDQFGQLLLDRYGDEETLIITDRTPITNWEYREERNGVLSQVAVRRRSREGIQWVSDSRFQAEGGCARRIITVPNTMGTAAMRYTADYQLRASRRGRVRMTAVIAGAFLAWPGQLVTVSLPGFGANGRYRVAQAEVKCGQSGLTTALVLGETDSMI